MHSIDDKNQADPLLQVFTESSEEDMLLVNVKTHLEKVNTTHSKATAAFKASTIVDLALDFVLDCVNFLKMHTPVRLVFFTESVDKGKDWYVVPILTDNSVLEETAKTGEKVPLFVDLLLD